MHERRVVSKDIRSSTMDYRRNDKANNSWKHHIAAARWIIPSHNLKISGQVIAKDTDGTSGAGDENETSEMLRCLRILHRKDC